MPVNNSINLTPAAGGIVWSTATAFFTTAGTATAGQMLQSGNLATPTWSTATYPSTAGTAGQVIASDGTNFIVSTTTFPVVGGVAGNILISDGANYIASTSLWPNTVGAAGKILISDGASNVYSTPTYPNVATTANTFLRADGTNWVASTSTLILGGNFEMAGGFTFTGTLTGNTGVTFPTSGTLATTGQIPTGAALTKVDDTNVTLTLGGSPSTALVNAASLTLGWAGQLGLTRGGTGASLVASNGGIIYSDAAAFAVLAGTATAGQILRSGASAAPTWSTATFPNTATGTGTILRADGTNWVATTATYPNVATSTGSFLYADGTNYVASTSLWPNTVGSSGKVVISNGTTNVYSTPTFPNASATSGKIIKSDGTNWVASTETYAAPGTSGNVMTSDGTNWTSATPASGGLLTATVTLTQGQLTGMFASPVQLIAAPGANTVIVLVFVSLYLNFQTTAFTASSGKNVIIKYSSGGSTSAIESADAPDNTFLGASSSRVQYVTGNVGAQLTGVSNAGIFMTNGGASGITGGNAASTIVVTLQYYTITAST